MTHFMVFGNEVFEDQFCIIVGFACVDGEWFTEFDGVDELSAKDRTLDITRRIVIMVI